MGNSRKQSFTVGQELVLMRDLLLSDLGYTSYPRKNERVVREGAKAEFQELGETEGNVRVQFAQEDFQSLPLSGSGIRRDGLWSIDADLLQPAYNPETIQPGQKFISTDTTKLFMSSTPIGAGVVFTNVRSNPGVDGVGDIRVEYKDTVTGGLHRTYVRWYAVLPYVAPEPEKLWGKYAVGQNHYFHDGKELMVVAIRNVGRRELVRNPKNMTAEEREIHPVSNKMFLAQGQIGYVDVLSLLEGDEDHTARVWHFDHYFKNMDFWNVQIDTIVPLLNLKTGQPMTLDEFNARNDSDKYLSVGFEATISSPVRIVEDGEITDEIDWRFRDGDDVVILEIDKSVDLDEYDSLVYKVGFNADGSGPTTWVRQADLYESPEDQD